MRSDDDDDSITKKKRSPRINSKGMEKDLLLSPGSPRSPREVTGEAYTFDEDEI